MAAASIPLSASILRGPRLTLEEREPKPPIKDAPKPPTGKLRARADERDTDTDTDTDTDSDSDTDGDGCWPGSMTADSAAGLITGVA
jgi:hypothetical protein